MTDAPDMRMALAELRRIMNDLHRVSRRADAERRHDLVRLRRQLSEQMPTISAAAEHCAPLIQHPELFREFRERFSAMRSAIALHQARWPAVSIDEGGEPYRQSAAAVRTRNADFLEWMDSLLAAPRHANPKTFEGQQNS